MPIYRCNQCSFVSEDAASPIGSKVACGRCGTACTVYGTVFYVEKLVERYFAARRELAALQQAEAEAEAAAPAPGAHAAPTPTPTPASSLTVKQGNSTVSSSSSSGSGSGSVSLGDTPLHNTTRLATAEQHAPLQAWFVARQMDARLDHSQVDTSGFFDDAAQLMGQGYALYAELIERVRFAYRKSHGWVNLELANLSQKDAQAINTLCRQLYSHTFFARYHYQKQEKIVRLTLQTAPNVRQFFDGGWLEWYAFMELVKHHQQRGEAFSCARGAKVVFANEDLHELDVISLPQGQAPICIECKSGEFRRDIDKYLRLRKRLGLERSRFIVCAADLSDEQAAGLSAMYELTFVNLQSLGVHLQTLA